MNTLPIVIELLQIALLAAAIALAALLLYKTRKIHLATYSLVADVTKSRQEIETLFSQIQSLLALERKLALSEALPPMRGWTASPDFPLRIANEVDERKPITLLECSSGVFPNCYRALPADQWQRARFQPWHDPKYALITRK